MTATHQGEPSVRADQAHTRMPMDFFVGLKQHALGFSLPLLCFLLISASTAIGLLASFRWGNANGSLVLLACLCGSVLLILPIYRSRRNYLAPADSPISLLGGLSWAALAFLLMLALQAAADFAYPLFADGSSVSRTALGNWMFLLSVGVLMPVLEEMAFRGWAIPMLSRAVGTAGAVLLSAGAFTLVHLSIQPVDVAFYFLTGIILGYLWLKVRVIWPGVLVHAANNLLVLYASADPGLGW